MSFEIHKKIEEMIENGQLKCPTCKKDLELYVDSDIDDLGKEQIYSENLSCSNCESAYTFKVIPLQDNREEPLGNDDFTIEIGEKIEE